MQSQQKKIKWSRGETADALEERTDTGITQVSVSRLENIIADVYGNISRRPALKTISAASNATDIPVIRGYGGFDSTTFVWQPQSFVFTVDANTYIIFIVDTHTNVFGGMLIENGKFVKHVAINNPIGLQRESTSKQISSAQYNNYMVVSNLYITDVIFRLTPTNDIDVEPFQFSAPWYAPEGTKTTQVTSSEIPGLEFDASSIGNYTYTEANGTTTVYSWIKTGLSSSGITCTWTAQTTTYYLCSIDGGNSSFITTTQQGTTYASWTMTNGNTYTNNQTLATVGTYNIPVKLYLGGSWGCFDYFGTVQLDVSSNINIQQIPISLVIPVGSIVQFPNNGAYMRVEGFDSDGTNLRMYGAFLTPVANDTAKDSRVKVEYGYIPLDTYTPKKFAFSDQRLYASGFYNANATQKIIPGYTVGSQIGRYNDFKNDYNTANEAVSIDISTSYQEEVVSLIDYNGLKIFTDSAEYAYTNGAIIKQSENGSLSECNPIVVGSVCLYADKSGRQLRAMQYEFQSDLFTSSSINQMAKEDLIFNTTSMASHLDKEHFTGRFLYAIQHHYTSNTSNSMVPYAEHSLAVCNFVPGNQAMVWSRWTSPEIDPSGMNLMRHTVSNVIEVNNKVWFVIACEEVNGAGYRVPAYTLAELDYTNILDVQTVAQATDTTYVMLQSSNTSNLYAWVDQNDPTNIVYTKTQNVLQGDPIYDETERQVSLADNSPGGPNIVVGGVGFYEWGSGMYTKTPTPEPTGNWDDLSRAIYDSNGNLMNRFIQNYIQAENYIKWSPFPSGGVIPLYQANRVLASTSLQYTISGVQKTADYDSTQNLYTRKITMPNATVSVFDGTEYKWDDTTDEYGNLTKSLSELQNPQIGFMINAVLESHPLDVGGKTYTDKKRIGKAVAVIRDTEPGAFTVCQKTGYTSPDKKTVSFYGCTGMKDQVRYTIKNIQGAKFTIESLTMIIEYGTLES